MRLSEAAPSSVAAHYAEFQRLPVAGGREVLLWASGAFMTDYFASSPVCERIGLRGRRVLEIGAGAGTLARVLAQQGAEVTAADVEPELTLLKSETATHAQIPVRVVELWWGAEGWRQSVLSGEEHFDFVFCADLIAFPDLHEVLLYTLGQLIGPSTTCFFGFRNRDDFSMSFMADLHDLDQFEVAEEAAHEAEDEEILLYRITRKKK